MTTQSLAGDLPAMVDEEPSHRLAYLFDTHYSRLYRLARRLVPTADDARDLVQDAFLRVARKPAAVPRGRSAEEAWLVRCLVNLRRDQWRREAVRSRHDLKGDGRASVPGTQEAGVIAHALVWRGLDALAPRRRTVVVLHELEGLTVEAIASLLGIAAVTARWHLAKGRRELASVLKPLLGGSYEDH
ncbi:MAG: RNA polymerase sigma factor [Vicinamibacterales bacterium]